MHGVKLYISLFILFIIGLHVLPVLQELLVRRQTFWPIMAWGMYRHPHDPRQPIQTSTKHILGVKAGGEVVQIVASDIPLLDIPFDRIYLGPLLAGDSTAARRLADRINRGQANPFVEFRLEDTRYVLTATGIMREVTPLVVYRFND